MNSNSKQSSLCWASRKSRRSFSILAICETFVATTTIVVLCNCFTPSIFLTVCCFGACVRLLHTKGADKIESKFYLAIMPVINWVFPRTNLDEDAFSRPLFQKPHRETIEIKSWIANCFAFVLVLSILCIGLAIFIPLRMTFTLFITAYLAFAKTTAVLFHTISHPLQTFKRLPRNWHDATFRIDSTTPIYLFEALGSLLYKHDAKKSSELRFLMDQLTPTRIINYGLREKRSGFPKGFWGANFLQSIFSIASLFEGIIHTFILFIPCYLVRFSSKAVAFFVGPIYYLNLKDIYPSSLRYRIAKTLNSKAAFSMRIYAGVMILLTLGKLFIYVAFQRGVTQITTIYNSYFTSANWIIQPTTIEFWQIAAFVSHIIVFATYFYADSLRLKLENDVVISPNAEMFFKKFAIARFSIALYTTSVFGYLFVLESGIPNFVFESFRFGRVFPWA